MRMIHLGTTGVGSVGTERAAAGARTARSPASDPSLPNLDPHGRPDADSLCSGEGRGSGQTRDRNGEKEVPLGVQLERSLSFGPRATVSLLRKEPRPLPDRDHDLGSQSQLKPGTRTQTLRDRQRPRDASLDHFVRGSSLSPVYRNQALGCLQLWLWRNQTGEDLSLCPTAQRVEVPPSRISWRPRIGGSESFCSAFLQARFSPL